MFTVIHMGVQRPSIVYSMPGQEICCIPIPIIVYYFRPGPSDPGATERRILRAPRFMMHDRSYVHASAHTGWNLDTSPVASITFLDSRPYVCLHVCRFPLIKSLAFPPCAMSSSFCSLVTPTCTCSFTFYPSLYSSVISYSDFLPFPSIYAN